MTAAFLLILGGLDVWASTLEIVPLDGGPFIKESPLKVC